ncbi:uncharacterized protein LOC123506695 [Portunus trituberculatus]|uniref:uncharacterized protein LOC123506695 n=1 Tax=Portunus trituberculatus TaxID=210409 RepID=UPI001E1CF58E|nr:uncharacterized protein LOC123506695 [Portunus trituberculatus]
MSTPEAPSSFLHQETFNIVVQTTTNDDLEQSHSTKDKCTESSGECPPPSDIVRDTTINLHESSAGPSVMVFQPPQSFQADNLQEPQELFQDVLDSQPPQDLLLSDLEPRTQELLLHDMQPSHGHTFPTQPQDQAQGFMSTGREKDDLGNTLSFPIVESFFAPLSQDLVAIGESPAECDATVPSHLSASLEYSDVSYEEAEAPTVVTSTAPKVTQRFREKRKSKSVYKHVPHREKPQHLVARRNARERRRVQSVNVAFSRLRRVVPGTSGRSKRVSKVKTLQGAMDYISHLQALLQEPPDLCDNNFPAMCTPVPYSVYAPSVRIQMFRDAASSLRDATNVCESKEEMTTIHRQSQVSANSYGDTS